MKEVVNFFSKKQVVTFEIETTLDQISDIETCDFCDYPQERKLLDFRVEFEKEGKPAVAQCDVPGYKCFHCETESYDLDASIEMLEEACKLVKEAGDMDRLEYLEASLRAGKMHRERWRKEHD